MKKIIAILVSLLMVLTFAACSAGMKSTENETAASPQGAGYGYTDSIRGDEAPAMEEGGWNGSASSYAKASGETPSVGESEAAQTSGRKLIRTVSLELQTLEFDTFTGKITELVAELGGYVENSSFNGNSIYYTSDRNASYTLRIPAARLDSFVDQVGAMANVTYRNENTQDVTLQYVDMEAHKKSLQTEYDRLLELLAIAESVDAIVTLEARLSEVRYQIESYESQLRIYDNQVDYSTVYLKVNEVKRETQADEGTVWDRISARLGDNFYQIGRDIEEFTVWFVGSLPYLLIWAVLLAVIALAAAVIVRGDRKRRERREAKRAGELRAAYEAKQAAEKPETPPEEKNE